MSLTALSLCHTTPRQWIIGSRRFEIHIQGVEMSNILTLKTRPPYLLASSETEHPSTQTHTTEERNPQLMPSFRRQPLAFMLTLEHLSSKRCYLLTKFQGVTSQQTVILNITDVRFSDLIRPSYSFHTIPRQCSKKGKGDEKFAWSLVHYNFLYHISHSNTLKFKIKI